MKNQWAFQGKLLGGGALSGLPGPALNRLAEHGPGPLDRTHVDSGPSEVLPAFCLTCFPSFLPWFGLLADWFPASLSLFLVPQTCCVRLLLNADLGSPVWLQLACVPWMCELLVPLSSILGPSNPAPGPCPAQPTPLCPGPQQGGDGTAAWVSASCGDSA